VGNFATLLSFVLAACGDDSAPARDSGPAGDAGEPVDQVRFDEAYAGSCTAPVCNADEVATACSCVRRPAEDREIDRVGCSELVSEKGRPRTPENDFCDPVAASARPNLGCMMPGMYRPDGTPEMITVYGIVDVFGNGADADQITVTIYNEGADGALGSMIGQSVAMTSSDCAETEDLIDDDMVVGTRNLGFYSIPNVPTETPLIVKTTGNLEFWRDLYTYNVVFINEEVVRDVPMGECADTPIGNRFRFRARSLSRGDYGSIPRTSGLPAGITNGNGAVAGEAHDCDDVRLESAHIATSRRPQAFVYFNDNPSNPLPEIGRVMTGTSLLGLYSALDISPGPVDVAAVGRLDGEVVSLGWYRVQVFPNSVSVVTFRGIRAHQVD
jgi:hypothetical protein